MNVKESLGKLFCFKMIRANEREPKYEILLFLIRCDVHIYIEMEGEFLNYLRECEPEKKNFK